VSSTAGEWLRVELDDKLGKFALTLSGFGRYTVSSQVYSERVEFRFYNDGVQVGLPIEKSACNSGNGLATFTLVPTGIFNRVDITPIDAMEPGGGLDATAFVLAEIKACLVTDATCTTPLRTAGNDCT